MKVKGFKGICKLAIAWMCILVMIAVPTQRIKADTQQDTGKTIAMFIIEEAILLAAIKATDIARQAVGGGPGGPLYCYNPYTYTACATLTVQEIAAIGIGLYLLYQFITTITASDEAERCGVQYGSECHTPGPGTTTTTICTCLVAPCNCPTTTTNTTIGPKGGGVTPGKGDPAAPPIPTLSVPPIPSIHNPGGTVGLNLPEIKKELLGLESDLKSKGVTFDGKGGFTTPKGTLSASSLGSGAALVASGYPGADAAVYDKAQKDSKDVMDKERQRLLDALNGSGETDSDAGGSGARGPGGSGSSPFGTAAYNPAAGAKKKPGAAPTVAGLSKSCGTNCTMGVSGDSLFEMIERRYKEERTRRMFIESPAPTPAPSGH